MLKKLALYPLCLTIILAFAMPTLAKQPKKGWQRTETTIKAHGNSKIKAIHYPSKKEIKARPKQKTPLNFTVGVIDSPPIDGFVPWITVSLTDARSADDKWNAVAYNSVVGNFVNESPGSDPNKDFVVGLFDTGAGITLIDYEASRHMGITDSYLTEFTIDVGGANSSVMTTVSYPLGIFIDGTGILNDRDDPNKVKISNFNSTVGTSNVSVAFGESGDNLPVAIGAPTVVHFSTFFNNRKNITVNHRGEQHTGPEIKIRSYYQSHTLPDYPNELPLAMKPGGTEASYMPWIDVESFEFMPLIPTTVSLAGTPNQSLLFVPGVDLQHQGETAYDKQSFMIDTGAQVTVISKIIAARLGLDQNNPDFEVEIEDASGTITMTPGFNIDSLKLVTLGKELKFTNVPVVMIDIASPEGGNLDGIIGMNLFNEYNLVLHGGAFLESPYLTYIRNIPGDIAPEYGDEKVDIDDLTVFIEHWLTSENNANFDINCDINTDGIVNIEDLVIIANHWGLL
ncbi:MAG: aspartyl protease family protein [Phycisphaerae bacterium]|nr:aspartyl protease family protein [Phycisphaerae bacterium]